MWRETLGHKSCLTSGKMPFCVKNKSIIIILVNQLTEIKRNINQQEDITSTSAQNYVKKKKYEKIKTDNAGKREKNAK